MNTTVLAPSISMDDVYGPGRIYAPRAHDQSCEWISRDPVMLDSITGNQLAVIGAMPVVCSEGFNTTAGLELLAEAGLEPAPVRFHYRAGGLVEAVSHALQQMSGKLVLQHAYPAGVLPAGAEWIEPTLLRYLNNKANLERLAPREHVPLRKVVDRDHFCKAAVPQFPFVLKAVTEQSTGGGAAVMICRTPADLATAASTFAQCDRIVVESLLDIQRNPCLHFAVMPDGRVRYLGFADQDVTDGGKYRGNWMQLGASLPTVVVGVAQDVVRRAAALGYRGIAGIDMVLSSDGRVYVLDLNFRVNGSTAAVLLSPALHEERGPCLMHLRGFKGAGSANEMALIARGAVARGQMIPMSLFDAEAAGHRGGVSILRALVLGPDRDAILAIESELAAAGLT